MTTYTYSGTYNSSGYFSFGTYYDEFFFTSTAQVYTTNNNGAVLGTEGEKILRIDGEVGGLRYGAQMLNGENTVNIGSNGALYGSTYDALRFTGDENRLFNNGEMNAGRYGVSSSGDENEVENRGSISGSTGVYFGGDENLLENDGMIRGDGDYSSSAAYQAGVAVSGQNNLIQNGEDGQIIGSGDDVAGVRLLYNSEGTVIENEGEILSNDWYGVDFSYLNGNVEAVLENSGTVQGAEAAFHGGVGEDLVINEGEMIGDVLMHDGNDIFRMVGDGTVDGIIDGGEGNDQIIGGRSEDTIYGGEENDRIKAKGGDDMVDAGDDDDFVNAGGGSDEINGNTGDDTLKGGGGNDVVDGGFGHDTLLGGGGNDRIDGEDGNDRLNGGKGNDTLTGGRGADVFIFNGKPDNDRIMDFGDGNDRIDLSAFDASSFNDLQNWGALDEFGGGTLIDFSEIGGTGSVFLENVDIEDLSNSDFIF